MYCHTHHCHSYSCGCNNSDQCAQENSPNLKEDLSTFIDILKEKVLDVAYDLNYMEMLSRIEDQEIQISTLQSDISLLKSQVLLLTSEVDTLKNR